MCICVRSCSPSGCLLQGQPKYKIISLWKYLRNSSDFVGFSSHPAQNMLHISAFNVFTLGTSVRRVPERNIKILLLYCVWSASIICYFESMIMLIYREKCVQMNRKIKMYESWKVLEWVEIGSNDFFLVSSVCLMKYSNVWNRKWNQRIPWRERVWGLNWFMKDWYSETFKLKNLQTQTNWWLCITQ